MNKTVFVFTPEFPALRNSKVWGKPGLSNETLSDKGKHEGIAA